MAILDKQRLCAAFCGEIELHDVPAGLAIRTGFSTSEGDAIGFYVTRDHDAASEPRYRIEDAGLLVPALEASGVNLESGTRSEAFRRLLQEHGAEFDIDSLELHSQYVTEAELPSEAMRFMALMLRVQDLELLNPETVENTFRDDAEKVLRKNLEGKASLSFHAPPAQDLAEFEADVIISTDKAVVALYLGTTDSRVDEAVMLWMENRYMKRGIRVALLLEKEKPPHISNRSLRRAMNRLDATTAFRGDELGAITKISSIAGLELNS
jgi:hypothetical protein